MFLNQVISKFSLSITDEKILRCGFFAFVFTYEHMSVVHMYA